MPHTRIHVSAALAAAAAAAAARLDLTTAVDRNLYALYASEGEVFLCQETSFAWLRRLGGGSMSENRLRLRRGYEPPATKVGGGWGSIVDHEIKYAGDHTGGCGGFWCRTNGAALVYRVAALPPNSTPGGNACALLATRP
jgi:hypothetical protein